MTDVEKYTKAEQDDINEWGPILKDEENRRIAAKPATTLEEAVALQFYNEVKDQEYNGKSLIEQVRFNVDFMVIMLHVSRFEEADQAVQRIHVLLDEMEAESGINSVMSL